MFFARTFLLIFSLIFITPGIGTASDTIIYNLATASRGGTYYPVGEALQTLTKTKLAPIQHIGFKAMVTAGSKENLSLLHDNKAQFAILQGLYGYYAWNGKGPLSAAGPQKDIRSICMLWKNVEHFIIRSDKAKTGNIADMKLLNGSTVALGKKGSGSFGSNTLLLKNLNMSPETSYNLMHGGYGKSINAFLDDKVEGVAVPAGIPAMAVSYAFRLAQGELTILEFSEEQARQADGGYGLWSPYTIAANTYPGLDHDVMTIAQPNFLSVRADMDEESVYRITKLIFENLGFLQNIHKATLEMSKDKALDGLPMPLHPGAARYFDEIGVKIPANLIAG